LPAARVLEIGLALAEALGHLHRHGLVHRDVKPSNVIFVNGRPKLADIGLVTDASDQCSIVGTEGYLPPEGPGTPQADIFALGKVLYEAATGLDRRQCPRLPEDLRSWADAKLVFELNEILLKSCASDPRARYASAEAMLADLQLLRRGRSVKSRRSWDRLRVAVTKLGIALVVLALLAAGAAVISQRSGASMRARDGPASTNTDANALRAKGMLILRGDNYPQFAEAYTNFHQALELDPRFARPYIGLLELRLRESVPALGPTRTCFARSRRAARAATGRADGRKHRGTRTRISTGKPLFRFTWEIRMPPCVGWADLTKPMSTGKESSKLRWRTCSSMTVGTACATIRDLGNCSIRSGSQG
jgi:hypothetical protein